MNDDLLQLTNVDTKADPPPRTDLFFSDRALLRTTTFDALRFGTATAIGWAIMFLIVSLVAALLGGSPALGFFSLLYPGFTPATLGGLMIGFAWSFLYGLIFGLLVAALYNGLSRSSAEAGGGYETYG